MDKVKVVLENLKNLDLDSLLNINNTIAGWDGSVEYVEENGEDFLQAYFEGRLDELARAIYYGNYKYCDSYIKFDAYCNLVTCDYPDDEGWIDFDTIAQWLVDNDSEMIEEYDLLESEEDEELGVEEEE